MAKAATTRVQPTPAGPGFLGIKELYRLSPQGLAHRRDVVALLNVFQIPNPHAFPAAAARALQILYANSWLVSYVTKGDPREFMASLRQVAGAKAGQQLKSSESWSADVFRTIFGRPSWPIHIERLRAVYILARYLSNSADPHDRLNADDIRILAGVIHRLDEGRSSDIGTAGLESAATASSLKEIGASVAKDLSGQTSGLAKRWSEVWLPWIERLSTEVEHPTDTSDPSGSTPEPIGWTTPIDVDGEEPGVEFAPILLPTPRPKGIPAPSSSFVAAFSDHAIRSRNLELSKDHVEVATDVEVRIAVRHCRMLFKQSGVATHWDLAPTLLLLQIVTGRTLPVIADAYISPARPPDGEPHLVIDLKLGLISCPVLTPAQIRRPPPETQELFEPSATAILLPLPKIAWDFLRRMRDWRKVERVVDWLDNDEPEQLILSFLRTIPELPSVTYRSLAPFRRWLPCQLQETGGDIAKTMLLVGQTFGRSSGPLFYFAPKQQDLKALYQSALADFFEFPKADPSQSPQTDRVGPARVVKFDLAKAGVGRIGRRLSIDAGKALADRQSAIRYHNSLADYLGRYIAVITSHRPTDALFKLTRRNFDLRNNLAILEDKPHDPEHFTRLVATTPDLSRSISLFLSHLLHLCELWGTADAKQRAQRIATGDAPLLQYLSESGDLRVGEFDDFKRGAAETWKGLPENWHRPLLAMQLREEGAQPLSVLAQLGHLEAASHPFLEDSVVSPLEVVDAVRPAVIRYERRLGFRVIPGFSQGQAAETPPLYTAWSTALELHDGQLSAVARKQAGVLRARLKENRLAASAWLLKVSESVNPTLGALIKAVHDQRSAKRGAVVDPSLRELDVADQDIQEILARNEADHKDNVARQIAVHNLLCRRLRSATSDAKASVMDIGLINLSPRAELSPLLAINCSATEQMSALRDWFEGSVRSGRTFHPQVLRTLALILFEGLRDENEVLALSRLQGKPVTFSGEGSVICVDIPGRRGSTTLSGLPALSLSIDLRGADLVSSVPALSKLLSEALPAPLSTPISELALAYWATTAQIASRIEKPGLIRYASERRGVLEAPAEQQAAFFLKSFPVATDHLPPIGQLSSPIDLAALNQEPALAKTRVTAVSGELWHRFQRLNNALNHPAKVFSDFKQPVPGMVSKFQQATLKMIEGALDLCEPASRRDQVLDIVGALASFAKDLCIHGTRQKANPAVNTVDTYFHDLARTLFDVFEGVDLRSLEEEDFDAAYELFKGASLGKKSAGRKSMALADFHHHLVEAYGLPAVVTPWIGTPSPLLDRRPDPALLTEAQYLAARNQLLATAETTALHSFDETTWRRIAHAAVVVLILLRRSGARISEGALLRQVDIWAADGAIFMLIRPSLFRQLKTAAATRRIDLTDRLDETEKRFLLGWINSEVKVHVAGQRKTLLFPQLGEPDHPIGVPLFRRLIQEAFRVGAGINVHPHQLRHLWLSEETDMAARSQAAGINLMKRVRRFESIRLGIGHSRLRTGTSTYNHTCLSFYRLHSHTSLRADANRWTLAALSGSTVRNADQLRHRFVSDDTAKANAAWTDVMFTQRGDGRTLPVAKYPSPLAVQFEVRHSPISVPQLDRYVRLRRAGNDADSVAVSFGLSASMTQRIEAAAHDLAAAPTYFRLLPSITRRKMIRQEPLPRNINSGLLEKILERASSTSIDAAESIFRSTYTPSGARVDRFVGTDAQLDRLRVQLIGLGLDPGSINVGTGELRIARGLQSVGRFHSVAWALAIIALHSMLTNQRPVLTS